MPVHPIRNHDEGLAHEYQDILLNAANITTVPVTPITAQVAAELRAESRLKTPDAIHLATALNHQASSFLTNDRDFPSGTGVQILKLRLFGEGKAVLNSTTTTTAVTCDSLGRKSEVDGRHIHSSRKATA